MEQPVVRISQGQLRGSLRTDINGGKIYSFLGVPYAQPPIGELRFKTAVPAEPWSGVRDATKDGDACYSKDMMTGVLGGSEDCLHLNIFTKSLPGARRELKPVMVWIHGGGFVCGSNRTEVYGPEFLLTEDIVLVSINYRLGALGFLSVKDTSLGVPRNVGLKDQVQALKWIQDNIENFNGDPHDVTIFGESAGAVSVHYHVLSSFSKGLFHKAILQSGCALHDAWPLAEYAPNELVKQLDRDASDEKEALQILRETSFQELYEAQLNIKPSSESSDKIYFGMDKAFPTKSVLDTIRSGEYNQVPIMIGYTNREMMIMALMRAPKGVDETSLENKTPNVEKVIPWQIKLEDGSEARKIICQKLIDLYFKGPDMVDNENLLCTDQMVVGIMSTVKNHLATSQRPIYFYRMSLDAELNVMKNVTKLNQPGACHCDDLGYLFKTDLNPEIKPGSLEDKSVRRFVKLWTNFAKYGNPTPDIEDLGIIWEPVKQGTINFLDIGEELTSGVNPEAERMALWREIYNLNPDTKNFL